MRKKITVLALCATLLALSVSVEAQQATKVYRIGYLSAGTSSSEALRLEAFYEGLRERG